MTINIFDTVKNAAIKKQLQYKLNLNWLYS